VEITEVRIKLMENAEDRLRAFCSITFNNSFVVRDLKIIDGPNGPFVAMPSRKLTAHCPFCNAKNHLRARFCNQCGKRLPPDQADTSPTGRIKLYADIAHPINARSRELIQERVIQEFREELERARQPGYVSRYDDDYDDVGRRAGTPSPAESRAPDAAEPLKGPHTPQRTGRSGALVPDARDDPGASGEEDVDVRDSGSRRADERRPDNGGSEGEASSRSRSASDFGNGIF
jgi:stage V sporulation protein G